MIGSTKKVSALFEKLRDSWVPAQQLQSVYAPIGLELGGETPEEIAFSILAEILMVKNKGSGMHLTTIGTH